MIAIVIITVITFITADIVMMNREHKTLMKTINNKFDAIMNKSK